jgi:ATP-dependent Zn protease
VAVKLRPPLITFERVRLSAFIVGYITLAEYTDPRPFSTTTAARILYVLLVVEIVRQWWVWRLEVSHEAVVRQADYRTRWDRYRSRFSTNARFRLRRAVTILLGLYTFGLLTDQFTPRCDGALQCVMLAPRLAVEQIPTMLQLALVIALSLFQMGAMFYAMVKVGFVKFVYPGTITESFDDVWGQDEPKAKMVEQVALLEDDKAVAKAGGQLPKGVLLWGPPGTGKTLLAKAVANASTKPLILVPPGAFQATFVGVNILKVHVLFRSIRKLAMRYQGVIVFIDEIDSLGNRGGGVDQSRPVTWRDWLRREQYEWVTDPTPDPVRACTALPPPAHTEPRRIIVTGGQMGTLESFLSGFDGMGEPRGLLNKLLSLLGFKPLPAPEYRYMMIGATNRRDALDAALRRQGRFGREIHVGYPKYEGKLHTYQGYTGRIVHELTEADIEWAARVHHHATGAAVQGIINEAVLRTFREGRGGMVTRDDLTKSMIAVTFGEPEGLFENDDNVWGVAVHEASHAIAFHHLRRDRMDIWFASIEQRRETGGMVAPSPKDDDWKLRHREMMAEICVSQASMVGELLILGEASNGHGGDGPHATRVAEQVIYNGHTFTVDGLGGPVGQLSSFGAERDPEKFHELREQVLAEAWRQTWELLEARQDQIEAVANLLVEHGTVSGDVIHGVLDGMEAVA